MTRSISNSDDLIDSRDVIERIDELEGERESIVADLNEAEGDAEAGVHATALAAWDDDYGAELKALQSLADDASGYADDWRHGATLIADSYFETYARGFAEENGAIPDDAQWPATCIDWKQAAEELQQDYTRVDFDGTDYWIR